MEMAMIIHPGIVSCYIDSQRGTHFMCTALVSDAYCHGVAVVHIKLTLGSIDHLVFHCNNDE